MPAVPEAAAGAWRRSLPHAGAGVALRMVAVVALGGAALAGMLLAAGFDAPLALAAMWRGAFGSVDAVLSATLVRSIPLLLAGVGMVVALRAGVLNIGGDGQLLAGATAAVLVALAAGGAGGPIVVAAALLASALAGAGWAGVPAWLKARFDTLEVVSTIMMNFVAIQVVSFLVRGPLQEPTGTYPQSEAVAAGMRLPLLIAGSRLHAGLVAAVVAAVAAWVFLEHTAAGLRLRLVGLGEHAAASAGGIDVRRVRTGAFLASGALAGLAGGVEVLGVTYALYENLSPGYGYTAIAVALLAGLRPLAAAGSALLLGSLGAGAAAMQRDAGVPAGAAVSVEAVLVLAVLAAQAAGARRRRGALAA